MEDDSDWDVSFRSQLSHFALGSNYISNTPKGTTPHSPYGEDWDLLWLGHCSSLPQPDDPRRFVIDNDPTVTPPKHRINFGPVPNMTYYSDSSRIVYAAKSGICLYAYALSHRGAQKILYHLSVTQPSDAVDLGIKDMCKFDPAFKCVGVFPQIVDSHRSAGSSKKDSDMGREKEQVREHSLSYNIVYSTRLNAEKLLNGQAENVTSQWPGDIPNLEGPVRTSFAIEPR